MDLSAIKYFHLFKGGSRVGYMIKCDTTLTTFSWSEEWAPLWKNSKDLDSFTREEEVGRDDIPRSVLVRPVQLAPQHHRKRRYEDS